MADVIIKRGRAQPLWHGHPWAFAQNIKDVRGEPADGDVVTVRDHEGRLLGRGFYNSRSRIPLRLLTHRDESTDRDFMRRRLASAMALRTRLGLPDDDTTAYRLLNSEGDGLPGLVVDVYERMATIQITTLGMARRRDEIVELLQETGRFDTLIEIAAGSFAELEGFESTSQLLAGAAAETWRCREDGLLLELNPLDGQKTGLFLDQRDNRRLVTRHAAGARVFDGYCYVGGFAMQAARAGAASVLAVDASARAAGQARHLAQLNKLDITVREADVFHALRDQQRAFDLVVIDPPKFARAKKDAANARRKYQRLNELAMNAVAAGGLLLTCSCSQAVTATDFERTLAAAAREVGRQVRILQRHGSGADHPLPPGFAEGDYLKAVLLALD